MSISANEPSWALITPAKYLKWSTPKGKSAAVVSLIPFPLSQVSASANMGKLSSITWAILFKITLRSVTLVLPQESLAAWAASSALLISASLERAILHKTLPLIGVILSKNLPSTGSTNLPFIKLPYFSLYLKAINTFLPIIKKLTS